MVQKLWSTTVILDGPKFRSTTVIFDRPKLRSTTVFLYGPKLRSKTVVLDGPKLRLTGGPLEHCPFGRLSFVILDGPNNAIWTKKPSSLNLHTTGWSDVGCWMSSIAIFA